jgi:2-phospho-L-lactate guanylyltransferase
MAETIVLMTGGPDPLAWRLVVPVKGGPGAKSRLHPPPGVERAALALALAEDCLTACAAGMPRGHLLVVTSDARAATVAERCGAVVVADPGQGLNRAVEAGRDRALADAGPDQPVAALLGDLPSLRPGDLLDALAVASEHETSVVPDASGTGTVLLCARRGAHLAPRFGPGSAARHEAAGYRRLVLPLPRLRTDVDDDTDLAAALALGVGPATTAALQEAATTLPTMQASVHSFDEDTGAGSVLLDDGRQVSFSAEVFAHSALRHLRRGQRLSIDLAPAGEVSRLWIVGIGEDQRIG